MAVLIATFADGGRLEFDRGAFDDWCVFLTRLRAPRHPPRDVDYFATMRALANRHGPRRVYRDFVAVYDGTTRAVDAEVVRRIAALAHDYGEDALEFAVMLTTIYAGMVAEENKANAKLGKRVKRLGVYQILRFDMPVAVAANHSRGKPWREIARECEAYGF